jgi:hypothetical protein
MAGRHILVSRRGLDKGPIDDALELLGLQRQIVTIVGGFATALGLAWASDLIATVPRTAYQNPARRNAQLSASGLCRK